MFWQSAVLDQSFKLDFDMVVVFYILLYLALHFGFGFLVLSWLVLVLLGLRINCFGPAVWTILNENWRIISTAWSMVSCGQ